jgi:hypothetical protein
MPPELADRMSAPQVHGVLFGARERVDAHFEGEQEAATLRLVPKRTNFGLEPVLQLLGHNTIFSFRHA